MRLTATCRTDVWEVGVEPTVLGMPEPQSQPDERLLFESLAFRPRWVVSIGGRSVITKRRLLFVTADYESWPAKYPLEPQIEIPIDRITAYGVRPWGIRWPLLLPGYEAVVVFANHR
jgi:hypothetical protein